MPHGPDSGKAQPAGSQHATGLVFPQSGMDAIRVGTCYTQNMTKATLGNRSFINQVKYSPKYQSVAMAGTNDANAWIGFNLGTGIANKANWVNVTGGNAVLPNRPVLGIALDPAVAAANTPIGYAAVGGFNANTPATPGHVFRVDCTADCASFTWAAPWTIEWRRAPAPRSGVTRATAGWASCPIGKRGGCWRAASFCL